MLCIRVHCAFVGVIVVVDSEAAFKAHLLGAWEQCREQLRTCSVYCSDCAGDRAVGLDEGIGKEKA